MRRLRCGSARPLAQCPNCRNQYSLDSNFCRRLCDGLRFDSFRSFFPLLTMSDRCGVQRPVVKLGVRRAPVLPCNGLLSQPASQLELQGFVLGMKVHA